MSHNQLVNEVKQNNFLTVKDIIVNLEWMNVFWAWADKYHRVKEVLPGNKKALMSLKKMILFAPFYNNFNILKGSSSEDKNFDELIALALRIDEPVYIPKEIGRMKHLEEFCISLSPVESLPDDIVCLQNLKKLCLCHNKNLILTSDQKLWIRELEENAVDVSYDEDLLYRTELLL